MINKIVCSGVNEGDSNFESPTSRNYSTGHRICKDERHKMLLRFLTRNTIYWGMETEKTKEEKAGPKKVLFFFGAL
jgi:hypothetical protein